MTIKSQLIFSGVALGVLLTLLFFCFSGCGQLDSGQGGSIAFSQAVDHFDSCFRELSDPDSSSGVIGYTDGTRRISIFVDPETGVNYFTYDYYNVGANMGAKTGGLCPRYNADGSLYVGGASS